MADNKISSSKKEIYTKLLDIAEKYTDIENTDFLKSGLFGYMTESMAMMMRDSTFHKSMLYNESFLNTARIPKSVYNWAKMFNIEVQKATPKYAEVEIMIPTSSITQYLDTHDKEKGLILDRNDPIIAGDYYFSLERSLVIKEKEQGDSYIVTYADEYETTAFENLKTKFIKTKVDGGNLLIYVRIYQYKKTSFIRQITTNSFLNKIQKVEFEDQFCGAKLFYEENGEDIEVPLFYSDMNINSSKKIALYNLTDSNELELTFKYGDKFFRPNANTKLKIDVFTTKAEDAPVSFSGIALMLFSKTDMKTIPLTIRFNPTELIGGKNQPDIETVKKTIIKEISTRNTITTKADLDNFFDILTALVEDVNNGKVTFIKKRDDIVKREFAAYLLLRDNIDDSKTDEIVNSYSLSKVVPTNTLNLKFASGLTDNTLSYPIADLLGNRITEGDDATGYYICPFNIFISGNDTTDDSNILYVKYLYNLTDCETDLFYSSESVNSCGDLIMLPEKIRLYRGFREDTVEAEKSYKLSLTFQTNKPIKASDNNNDVVLPINGSIEIEDPSTGSKIRVTDGINAYSTTQDDGTYITVFEIPLNISNSKEFIFADSAENETFSKYANKINLQSGSSDVAFNSSSKLNINFNSLKINNNPCNFKFQTDEELIFFEHLDNIMSSSIIFEEIEGKKEIIGLTDVPFVHSSFFKDDFSTNNRKNGFIKQLFNYINILKNNLDRLETSTFFNMKFYNTYGLSNLYYTDTTNLKLDLEVILSSRDYETNEALKQEIKSYIRKVVDKMNSTQTFNLTSLTSILVNEKTYGKYIKYIKFIGLNGTFNQYIHKLSDVDEKDYPPEWLNIDAESLNSTTDGIGITFKYEP